jgi:HSP20 family molecular chaperone IbpA
MSRQDGEEAGMGGGPFDWEDFRNRFFGDGPWKQLLNSGTIPWVDRYVKEIVSNAVPAALGGQSSRTAVPPSKVTALACNVFETHRALIVRIRLPSTADPYAVRLNVSAHELKVSGLPDGEEKSVKLAAPVRIEAARAICRHRVVEVTLPKETGAKNRDVPIRFLDD